MRCFLYEFVTSGGLLGGSVPAGSLRVEGQAMLAALAADFSAVAGCETLLMRDGRLPPLEISGVEIASTGSPAEHHAVFDRLASATDWTVVIAPESDGVLHRMATRVLDAGGRLLSPSPTVVALAADKHRTTRHLNAAGIRAPQGRLMLPGDPLPSDFSYPAVLKPDDGAGSQDTFLLQNAQGSVPRLGKRWRLEPYITGQPASVAALTGPKGIVPLAPCRQRLTADGRFQYLGGALPLPRPLADRARQLAYRAIESLGPTVGYLGLDLVLGNETDGSTDTVIEINPRLTTSYVGLRVLARGNLASAMLAVAAGREATLFFGDELLEFDADGIVRPAGPSY